MENLILWLPECLELLKLLAILLTQREFLKVESGIRDSVGQMLTLIPPIDATVPYQSHDMVEKYQPHPGFSGQHPHPCQRANVRLIGGGFHGFGIDDQGVRPRAGVSYIQILGQALGVVSIVACVVRMKMSEIATAAHGAGPDVFDGDVRAGVALQCQEPVQSEIAIR